VARSQQTSRRSGVISPRKWRGSRSSWPRPATVADLRFLAEHAADATRADRRHTPGTVGAASHRNLLQSAIPKPVYVSGEVLQPLAGCWPGPT